MTDKKTNTSQNQNTVVSKLKNRLLDSFLLIGAILGLVIFLLSLYPWHPSYVNADLFVDIGVQAILFVVYYFRKKMNLSTKTAILLLLVFAAFISDLFENNLNATGISLIILIPFLSILVYDLRKTLAIFALSLACYSTVAYLYLYGYVQHSTYQTDVVTANVWVNNVATYVLLALIISTFVYIYNDSVDKIIAKLGSANSKLKERDDQLEESLNEKNVLLQEIHHRVKNNLAVVSGLLELQSYSIDDQESKYILRKSTNRIMSIAKVHEMLYESNNFTKIPFQRYIDELTTVIFDSMNQYNQGVKLKTDITVEHIGINHGVPLGIIFNELITNSIKYGFQNSGKGSIEIDVHKSDESIYVTYSDNGIGIKDFETASRKSLGFTLIESLLGQIDASYAFETAGRFQLTFHFPINTRLN